MGTITSCQTEFDGKHSNKEINSTADYTLKNKISLHLENKIKLKEKRINKSKEDNIKNKFNKKLLQNKNNNSRIKYLSKALKSKFIESSISYQKNSSNKITNSNISLTTNNNSKNIINNKRINTFDNTKNITGSDEDTIVNQNSIDYLINLDVNNSKYNNKMLNLKKKYFENNQIKSNKKKNQIINIINEENEDINLSKIYDSKFKNKNKRNKKKFMFASESQPIFFINNQSKFHKETKNIKYNRNKIKKNLSPNFSPQTTIVKYPNNNTKIYKKSSCFNLKANMMSPKVLQNKPIFKKIKKNKKKIKLDSDENNGSNKNNKEENLNQKYFFSQLSPLRRSPSLKNENDLLKNFEITKKKHEKEISLLKKKVNNLCNIIEDNKNLKEKEIMQKDKLISYLQNEKIKNENTIKKLKTQLKKEKLKSNKEEKEKNNINKNIYTNYTKINKYSTNNINKYNLNIKERNIKFKNECFSDIKNKTEIFKHLIYEKKNYKSTENCKQKVLRKSIPIKVNIDLTNKPLTQFKNDTYEIKKKETFFIKEIFDYNNKILNNNLKEEEENIYYKRFTRNKSDFNEKFKRLNIKNLNENLNNIVYIPKKSKMTTKFFLTTTNKEERNKIKYNNNSLPRNNKNKEIRNENKELQNDIIKETLSFTGTNYLNESLNNLEDITMNLNLTPIAKNYSKNLIQSIEDFSLYDLIKGKNNSCKNLFNTERKKLIYRNKLDLIDIIHRNKKYSLSPPSYKNNEQNYFYAKDYCNMWSIIFNIFEKNIVVKINKDTLLWQAFQSLANKMVGNKELTQKINFLLENKDKIAFLFNNNILDKNKSLEENKINNNSRINIIFIK